MEWNWHNKVSYLKSVFRIGGYIALPFGIWKGAVLLILAEVLGMLEELW